MPKRKKKKRVRTFEVNPSLFGKGASVNPYDVEVQAERDSFKRYYTNLKEACDGMDAWNWSTEQPDAQYLAIILRDKKMSMYDAKPVKRLIEVCKRFKIIERGENNNVYLNGIVNLGEQRWMWMRKPEEWTPKSVNRGKRFSELLRYLMVQYDVPEFLDKAWMDMSEEAVRHRQWFINLGGGENIRVQKDLPVQLSKKAAHWFLQTPSKFSIAEAFRWAQIMSMGADEIQARHMLLTRLRQSFENEDFWITVIRYFIDNPFLDSVHYGPICDYLQHKKFEDRGQRWIDGRLVELSAEQPNLSMSKRDPITLLEQVNRWHRDLNKSQMGVEDFSWSTCGIAGFEKKEKKWVYQIKELLDSRDLRDDGREMGHCVFSYAKSCKRGRCAIFSLATVSEEGFCREATIEVDVKDREIMQARKKFNDYPTNKDWKIMEEWAKQTGLTMNKWLQQA